MVRRQGKNLTIFELKKHPFFTSLGSENQKAFVLARCEDDKDVLEAAKIAWPNCSDVSARTAGNRAMNHANIAWLIAQFYGEVAVPTREQLARKILDRAQNADSDEAAFKLYALGADILGYKFKPADAPPVPPRFGNSGDESFSLE